MDAGTGRQYGNAEIGGHATVHQGDAHTSTALNISAGNTIHISVQGNIEWPSVARKRLLDVEDCDRDLCISKRKRLHDRGHCERQDLSREVISQRSETQRKLPTAQDQGLREQGVHLINQILQASGSREQVSLSANEHADAHHVHALHHLRSALCDSTPIKRGVLLTLVDHVRQNSLFPAIANVFPTPSATVPQDVFREAAMFSSSTGTFAPASGYAPAQDLVCVFLAMLAMLSCHGNNNSNTLTSRSSSSKVPLVAGLITFALARYLCMPPMLRQISEWAGGALVIQDPFMHDLRVPKAHTEHFTLLEAFLRLKLSGTTAEAFVKTGRFHLKSGHRYGRAIRTTDWSVKGRINSSQRVFMAVSLRREDATCVECQAQLIMSESGQFACHPCGKAYGNGASLKYLTETGRQYAVPQSFAASASKKHRALEGSKSVPGAAQTEDDEELDDEYDLYGIQNIDLHILRRKRRRRPGPWTTVTDHSNMKYDTHNSHAQLVQVHCTTAIFEATIAVCGGVLDEEPTDGDLLPFYVTVDNNLWQRTDLTLQSYDKDTGKSTCFATWTISVDNLLPNRTYACSFRLFHQDTEISSIIVKTLPFPVLPGSHPILARTPRFWGEQADRFDSTRLISSPRHLGAAEVHQEKQRASHQMSPQAVVNDSENKFGTITDLEEDKIMRQVEEDDNLGEVNVVAPGDRAKGSYRYGVAPQNYTKFYDSSSPHSSGEYVQYVPYQYNYLLNTRQRTSSQDQSHSSDFPSERSSPAGSPPPSLARTATTTMNNDTNTAHWLTPQPAQNNAWEPPEVMQGNQDMPMLDINWDFFDRSLPIEVNNGKLDQPKSNQAAQ